MTDTDMLYMASLEKRNEELEARIAELEDKHHNECGQIAHYSDELRKAKDLLRESLPILKAAVEDMNNSVNDVHCKYCSKWHTDQCQGTSHLDCYLENKFKWRHTDEAERILKGE